MYLKEQHECSFNFFLSMIVYNICYLLFLSSCNSLIFSGRKFLIGDSVDIVSNIRMWIFRYQL